MLNFNVTERNLNPKAACLKKREEDKTLERFSGHQATINNVLVLPFNIHV